MNFDCDLLNIILEIGNFISNAYFLFLLKVKCNDECQWNQEQTRRRDDVNYQCSNFGLKITNITNWVREIKHELRHILVSDKYKVMYCYLPKVACTNWKKLFLYINGEITEEQVTNINHEQIHAKTESAKWRLHHYSEKEILHRLKKYTSFVIVRNPVTRTLSCYRDKLETHTAESKNFRKRYGNKIHLEYNNSSETTNREVPDNDFNVTFQEFVKYLGDPKVTFTQPTQKLANERVKFTSRHPEEHWMGMADMCFPCQVGYDFIGKLETLDTDTKFILKHIGVSHLSDIIHHIPPHSSDVKGHPSATNSSMNDVVKKYIEQLSTDDIEGLRWRYEKDFKIFGYT